MVNVEKAVPAPKKPEPGIWRLLVAFLTDPECRQAFKDGWNRVKLEQEVEAKEVRIQKTGKLETENVVHHDNGVCNLKDKSSSSFDHFKASFVDPYNPFFLEEDSLVDPYFSFDDDSPLI